MSHNRNENKTSTSARAIAARGGQGEGGPRGSRIDGYAGPGRLRPGIGRIVQRSATPQYCGTMTGVAHAVTKHPNSIDATKTSTRFTGDCIAVQYDGAVTQVGEFYLPSTLERIVEAAIGVGGGGVEFSVEVWCEPDDRPKNTMGFRYIAYNRRPRPADDAVLRLAYATGMLEPPPPQAALPSPEATQIAEELGDDADASVDPETGEVTRSRAAQIKRDQKIVRGANDKRRGRR
jgi:hypothetical protein